METTTNEPQFRAQVIFARKMAGVWKLLPDTLDKQIEQALLSRASTILYQPQKNFTAEGIAEQDRKFHNDFLELMKKNGATPESITSQKEIYEVEQSGAKLNHWADWTNYFKTVILNPPVIFENRDVYPYNFEDPISAFRSYSRAMWVGDGKTLFNYADESGQINLKKIGVNTNTSVGTYDLPIMTHTTVLLVAATKFQGKDYVLVFWRAQNEKNPQSGSIALQSTIFVHQDNEYLLTSDLDDSAFGNILDAAHAYGGVWKYEKFERTLKQSEFPTNFYDVR